MALRRSIKPIDKEPNRIPLGANLSVQPAKRPGVEAPVKKAKFVPESEIEPRDKVGSGEDYSIPEYLVPRTSIQEYPPLPFFVSNTLVLGSSNSGKSVGIANILLHMRSVSHVFLFVKTTDFDKDETFRGILKDRKINFTVHEIEELPAVIHLVESEGAEKVAAEKMEKKPWTKKPLILFDDVGSDLTKNQDFIDFIKHGRKITAGIICSIQTYKQLPPDVWKNMKRFMIFTNLTEKELLDAAERIPSDVPSAAVITAVKTNRKPYNFITVDVLRGIITEKFSRVIYRSNSNKTEDKK